MGFFDIVKAFIPLIIIVALLYGVLIVVKKYGYNLRGKEFSPINIKIISTKMIMPKRFVSVIKVEGKLLVLGISEHSVNLIKELDPPEDLSFQSPDNGLSIENSGTGFLSVQKESFLDILKKNFGMK